MNEIILPHFLSSLHRTLCLHGQPDHIEGPYSCDRRICRHFKAKNTEMTCTETACPSDLFEIVITQIKLEFKHLMMDKNEVKKCIYVVHGPSGVPQFHQIVQRPRDQQVFVWWGPLHSSDPASVGGKRQQHQWAIWAVYEEIRVGG